MTIKTNLTKRQIQMRQKKAFTKNIIALDESVREIASLDELYNELLASKTKDKKELSIKKDEAAFAHDRILKLSLHVKHLLRKLESHETIK